MRIRYEKGDTVHYWIPSEKSGFEVKKLGDVLTTHNDGTVFILAEDNSTIVRNKADIIPTENTKRKARMI